MTEHARSAPSDPSVIDSLAEKAVSAAEEADAEARWRALWRRVLPLERWYFVRDPSPQLRSVTVTANGKRALPVFTDVERAVSFAEDGLGGADQVFASPPSEMLGAAERLETDGVEILLFNPKEAAFGAPPSVVRALAEAVLGEVGVPSASSAAGGRVTAIDRLALNARAHADDAAARNAMWSAVFALEHWFFVPRGEEGDIKPFAVRMEQGAAVLAFTTPERASGYAELRALEHPERLLAIPPVDAVSAFANPESAVKLIHFDTQHGAFFAPVADLAAMYAAATGTQGPPA